MTAACTHRLGVRLPLLKARIFDTIQAAGRYGISSAQLQDVIYSGQQRRTDNAMRVHVCQINHLFESTDWKIIARPASGPHARWFLVRCRMRTQEAAE